MSTITNSIQDFFFFKYYRLKDIIACSSVTVRGVYSVVMTLTVIAVIVLLSVAAYEKLSAVNMTQEEVKEVVSSGDMDRISKLTKAQIVDHMIYNQSVLKEVVSNGAKMLAGISDTNKLLEGKINRLEESNKNLSVELAKSRSALLESEKALMRSAAANYKLGGDLAKASEAIKTIDTKRAVAEQRLANAVIPDASIKDMVKRKWAEVGK